MPTFSPRNVDNGVEVTIKSGTSGAAIYYTTDGRTPTTESKNTAVQYALLLLRILKQLRLKADLKTVLSLRKK